MLFSFRISLLSLFRMQQTADEDPSPAPTSYARKPPTVKGPPPAHVLARVAPPPQAEEAVEEDVAPITAPVPAYSRKPQASKPPPPGTTKTDHFLEFLVLGITNAWSCSFKGTASQRQPR